MFLSLEAKETQYSPLILGAKHVFFGSNKSITFSSFNFRGKSRFCFSILFHSPLFVAKPVLLHR